MECGDVVGWCSQAASEGTDAYPRSVSPDTLRAIALGVRQSSVGLAVGQEQHPVQCGGVEVLGHLQGPGMPSISGEPGPEKGGFHGL